MSETEPPEPLFKEFTCRQVPVRAYVMSSEVNEEVRKAMAEANEAFHHAIDLLLAGWTLEKPDSAPTSVALRLSKQDKDLEYLRSALKASTETVRFLQDELKDKPPET